MPIKLPSGLGALGCLPGFTRANTQSSPSVPQPPSLQGLAEFSRRRYREGAPASAAESAQQRPRAALPVRPRATLGELFKLEDRQAGTIMRDSTPQGTLVGPGKRTEPLQRHEVQQAAYQLGAKLNVDALDASAAGRKNEDGSVSAQYADPSERQRLADGTQTMHDTRLSLQYGRSNVYGESDATKNGNVPRVNTSCDMTMGFGHSMGAGAALHLGAGNCDQNAWINTRMHADKLQPGETVNTLTSQEAHHSFTEVHTATPPGKPPAPEIVLDSWSSGPAVRLQHSNWAHTPVVTDGPWESFDRQSGNAQRQEMLSAKQNFQNGTWPEANESLKLNQDTIRPPKMFGDTPVVGSAFARQSADGLMQKDALGQEIMAAGAARDAYNLNVRLATRPETTTAVAYDALNLQNLSRPPVKKPPQ